MSSTPDHRHAADRRNRTDDAHGSPETLIELLGDDYARDILAAIGDEPKSARALAEECDTSRPTVYRRLERLRDAGLVRTGPGDEYNGHQRRTFAAAVETVGFELGSEGFEAELRADTSPVSAHA
jgi:DNA-binding transcriptional ArsR family regulator